MLTSTARDILRPFHDCSSLNAFVAPRPLHHRQDPCWNPDGGPLTELQIYVQMYVLHHETLYDPFQACSTCVTNLKCFMAVKFEHLFHPHNLAGSKALKMLCSIIQSAWMRRVKRTSKSSLMQVSPNKCGQLRILCTCVGAFIKC